MAIRSISELKSWFSRGKYPTGDQFADWMDSYIHKRDSGIEISQVTGLAELLNGKYAAVAGAELERRSDEIEADYSRHKMMSDELFDNIFENIEELEREDERQQGEIEGLLGMMKGGATIEDCKEALESLGSNYNTLHALATTLKTFLESADTKDVTINTWREIEDFLQGVTDSESLTGLLNEQTATITRNYTAAISEAVEQAVHMTEVTYTELVNLRAASGLRPGTFYRIIDYVTTVANDNEARSAGHVFDIIVLATSTRDLSEEAMAIKSLARDPMDYFAGAKLGAWRVWYCVDNDSKRFHWADEENGKGVIYRMIDEWGNDCPYDFKNVQFKRYLTAGEFVDEVVEDSEWNLPRYIFAAGMGRRNRMELADKGDYAWFYTFNRANGGSLEGLTDASLLGSGNAAIGANLYNRACHGNVMGAYRSCMVEDEECYIIQVLNNIVLTSCDLENGEAVQLYDNRWGVDCYNMTFHEHCYGNVFGGGCRDVIGFKTLRNQIGQDSEAITFGLYCRFNRLDRQVRYLEFGDFCGYNSVMTDCSNNIFGGSCDNNVLGPGCNNNGLGTGSCGNVLGRGCKSNTLGDGCLNNLVGNNCAQNVLGNYIKNLTVGNEVSFVAVSGGSKLSYIHNAHILGGTSGNGPNGKLQIAFSQDAGYVQYCGKNSAGLLKMWSPADLVP